MANKTGFVKVPGALTATDVNGIVAYTGDIKDDAYNKTQDVINDELLKWKASFTPVDPLEPDDWTNYYTKSETDTLLNDKIGLSNIIQQAYSTVEGLVVSNVDFSRNTLADYTTIPSMDVFKKFVPQIHDSHEIENAISSYGSGVFESLIGLSTNKIPTIGSVIDLIKASNDLYIPSLINDSGDYTHATLTQAVFSASYIDNAVFGAGGYGEFPKSSMKSYVDDLSTRVFTIDVNTSDGMHETEAFISNSAENIASIVTGIEEAITNNHPFIIAIKVQDGVLIGNVTMWESAYTNISAHSNQYDIYIHLVDEGDSTVTVKRADVSKAESEICVLVLEDVNDYPQVTNQFNRRSNAYENIGVLDAYDIFLNNGSVPLKYNGRIYQPSNTYIRNSDNTVIVQYVDFFDMDKVLKIHISENNVAVSRETPSIILGGTILENGLYTAELDVDMPDDSYQTSQIPSFLGNLYDTKIDNVLIGGTTVSKNYDSSLRKFVDLTDSLKQFCIWDNPYTMLSKLQNLNTSAADAYKYDFSGEGNYNVTADFNAYQNLKDNLVLEVNGLRKKLANINVGTTYATQSAFNTLAEKVYAGLYGNDTGTNTLGDTTKLQSLKAVVEFIGTKEEGTFTLDNKISSAISDLYFDVFGTDGDNGVIESADTSGGVKLGVKFNDNIGALNKIVTEEGYTTVNGYTQELGTLDNEDTSMLDYLMTLNNTAIPDAGSVAEAIVEVTGYTPDFALGDATINDRLSTLESFKESMTDDDFNPASVLGSISNLSTNVGNLSEAVDDIEDTISFIDANTITNIGNLVTTINIKAGSDNIITSKTIETDTHTIDLTALASRTYVDNVISNINSLGNLTPEDLNRLDALADNISNYALLTDVNTAVTGMLTQVKIGNVSANVTTIPGTAAFNVNDVKTALFGTANVLTSNSSIPWSKISFEGVTNPPITNITDDNIPDTIARKSDITITSIKQNGAAISPTNKVVDLGYKLTKITWSKNGVAQPDWVPNNSNSGVFTLGNIVTNTSDCIKGIQYTGISTATQTISVTNGVAELPVFDATTAESLDNITISTGDPLITYNGLTDYMSLYDNKVIGLIEEYAPQGSGGDASIPIDNLSSTVLANPNKVYKANTPLSALSIALQAPNNDNTNPKAAVYTFRFTTGSTFSGLKLKVVASNATNASASGLTNMNILYPYDITWNTNTSYEVSILYDGSSYSLKQVALQSTNTQDNTGYITIG